MQTKQSNSEGKVSYGRLTNALTGLGYQPLRSKTHLVFIHPKTRVHLILPPKRLTEQVDPVRLAGVYQLVESGGAVRRVDLDNALKGRPKRRATASARAYQRRANGVGHKQTNGASTH